MWKVLYIHDRKKRGGALGARFCFATKPHIVTSTWLHGTGHGKSIFEVNYWHAETGANLFSMLDACNPMTGSVDGCVLAATMVTTKGISTGPSEKLIATNV